MKPAREVSQTERILFPIVGLLLTTFIVPSGLPLLGMLFFGNLLKESGKTTRLAKTAGAALNDIVVMLLGLTVGCSTQASEFLTMNTIYIFAIGAGAFIIATMSGVCFVKLMNVFLPKDKKLNPLIGNAGVSAVPMAARISNNLGLEYDRHNFLLMHAMGPNVAGVIGSAVAAGALPRDIVAGIHHRHIWCRIALAVFQNGIVVNVTALVVFVEPYLDTSRGGGNHHDIAIVTHIPACKGVGTDARFPRRGTIVFLHPFAQGNIVVAQGFALLHLRRQQQLVNLCRVLVDIHIEPHVEARNTAREFE